MCRRFRVSTVIKEFSLAGAITIMLASCVSLPPSPKLEQIDPRVSITQQDQLLIHDLKQSPFTVAEQRNALQAYKSLTFDLPEVPKTAKLDVTMTVVTYACAIKPGLPQGQTHVLINGEPVAYWSFAYDDQGKSYRTAFDLDPKLLRVGQNKLEVLGRKCAYGNFELVRFHGIGLAAAK